MKKIFLCTAGDSNYFKNKIFNLCLESYSKEPNTEKLVFLVDTTDNEVNTFGINKKFIPWEKIKSKNTNKCIQHGEFSNFIENCEDDDIIIFTDGDIIKQRPFSEEEINFILKIQDRTFMANYNFHYKSNIREIIPQVGAEEKKLVNFIEKNFNLSVKDLEKYKEMNTGVLIGTKKNFGELAEIYEKYYEELSHIIRGFWNQQFLINIIINKFFKYEDLPYKFHTHTHHSIKTNEGYIPDHQSGVPYKVYVENGKYCINGDIILFAHKCY